MGVKGVSGMLHDVIAVLVVEDNPLVCGGLWQCLGATEISRSRIQPSINRKRDVIRRGSSVDRGSCLVLVSRSDRGV